jgi:hypothetical protein
MKRQVTLDLFLLESWKRWKPTSITKVNNTPRDRRNHISESRTIRIPAL